MEKFEVHQGSRIRGSVCPVTHLCREKSGQSEIRNQNARTSRIFGHRKSKTESVSKTPEEQYRQPECFTGKPRPVKNSTVNTPFVPRRAETE